MTGNSPRCCRGAMAAIGVVRDDGVLLHSCPSCGRHAWTADGRVIDRIALIQALRPAASPAPTPPAAPPAPASTPVRRRRRPDAAAQQRAELKELLAGFTVHGTSS